MLSLGERAETNSKYHKIHGVTYVGVIERIVEKAINNKTIVWLKVEEQQGDYNMLNIEGHSILCCIEYLQGITKE